MTPRQRLTDCITEFDPSKFRQFLSEANPAFKPVSENLNHYLESEGAFADFQKTGHLEWKDGSRLIAATIQSRQELTDRSGKKNQYELGKKVLKDTFSDGGLLLFYDSRNRFRLSFICTQYQGQKRSYSHFRRYTYYVSPELANHTFIEQVGKCEFSSIDSILKAFSIEAVNKEFYTNIATLFTQLVGGTRKIGSKTLDVETGCLCLPQNTDVTTKKEFAVRLIGRLIFCWFLKKKRSEAEIPLIPEEVLSSKAMDSKIGTGGYYHSVLEPLFFELLNTPPDTRNKEFKRTPWNTIPFLNGGLFTPHNHDYYEIDDRGCTQHLNTLIVPDLWIRWLLEIFERYNFTIDENTPVDIELAIEPEMLGRIFENLLAEINPETGETARKSTGSYYTPRSIVEYMVDESLKQYLMTQTGLPEDTLGGLLSYADEGGIALSEKQAESVINALHKVKILDPACGSGAFPMGILQKILLILQKLDPDSKKWLDKLLSGIPDPMYQKELKRKIAQPNYLHKLGIIRDCIFGVDIQPIAVEISKLRCFLSLIVDEKVEDNHPNRGVEHLPNLEFKFVCANSLMDLPKPQATHAKTSGKKVTEFIGQGMIFEATDEIKELKQLREEYLRSYGTEKLSIEKRFVEIQGKLRQHTLNWGKAQTQTAQLANWNPFGDETCPWFDPEWMFGVISGFDIVIANPPYLRQERIKELKPVLAQHFRCYEAAADIYVYFYERSIRLLRTGGSLAFITSNKYFRSSYGNKLRSFLTEFTTVRCIIDFGDAPVFEAIAYPSIIILTKTQGKKDKARVLTWKPGSVIEDFRREFQTHSFQIAQQQLTADGWRLESPSNLRLFEKLQKSGKSLGEYVSGRFYYGIKTGLTEAFVVDKATRNRLITEHKSSSDILKPFLRGRDVKRWNVEFADQYLIKIESSENKQHPWSGKSKKEAEQTFAKSFPAIHAHFEQFRKALLARDDQGEYFWELRSCAYWDEFEQPKIIFGRFMDKPTYAYDDCGFYHNDALYFASRLTPYLVAFLNSPVVWYYLRKVCTDLQNRYLQALLQYQEQIPIPMTTPEEKSQLEGLVRKVLVLKNRDSHETDRLAIEKQINQLVYTLYKLTEDEIRIVEALSSDWTKVKSNRRFSRRT